MSEENSLNELYQELLLEHFKQARNKGVLPDPACQCTMHNPLCGDNVQVFLNAKKPASKTDSALEVMFDGSGCSISQASASMMTSIVQGRTVKEAKELVTLFRKMMSSSCSETELELLHDAAALQGVKKFAARIRCAQLAWEALDKCLLEIENKQRS